MNRLVLTLTPQGEIASICADQEVEIFWNCPHVAHDRVYKYGAAQFGPQHVRAAIGGFAVGHSEDGVMNDGRAPFLPPSKPAIGLVKDIAAPIDRKQLLLLMAEAFENPHHDTGEETTDAMADVLTAIEGAGLRVVPMIVTDEMQRAYFDSIDSRMKWVETDATFGRHSNARIAYVDMLKAAPFAPEKAG